MNKHPKLQQSEIKGWGNQVEIQNNELILNNILRRKTTLGALPKINHQRTNSNLKKYSHTKLPLCEHYQKKVDHLKTAAASPEKVKEKIRLSQGPIDTILPLKQKLQALNQEEEELLKPTSVIREDSEQNENSRFTPERKSLSPSNQPLQKERSSHLLRMKTIVSKRENDSLASNFNRYDDEGSGKKRRSELKQTQSKTYLKLNTLNFDKKEKRKNFFQNPPIDKACVRSSLKIEDINDSIYMKAKYSKQTLQVVNKMEKVDKKMRQTFIKQDIFRQQWKKTQKESSIQEFNDDVMFKYNNSLNLLPMKSSTLDKNQKSTKDRQLKSSLRYKLILY